MLVKSAQDAEYIKIYHASTQVLINDIRVLVKTINVVNIS